MRFTVIAPCLNAQAQWNSWRVAIESQNAKPDSVLILDSESVDGTPTAARHAGFQVIEIKRAAFDHGGTRQLGVDHLPPDIDIAVFLTQDAILATPDALKNILAPFEDASIGMAYGRQLPRPSANPIEAHARLFNYPPQSHVRTYEDRHRLGLKAAFASNSFAAYRRSALAAVGGFPPRTIFAEDMIAAARMLKAGWRLAYAADATVYHSHGYSLAEEFRRYFDVGVLHARDAWLLNAFGKPEGEGLRFICSELVYLRQHAPLLIPHALIKTFVKYFGYRSGLLESRIQNSIKRRLSMNRGYWV